MTRYELNRLGSYEFEHLVQSLAKEVIGNGTITFGAGPDGGREAEFEGKAPYPSKNEQWDGTWIIQAKYHDIELLSTKRSRQELLKDLPKELDKFAGRGINNYILATNVPLSPNRDIGTLDSLRSIAKKHPVKPDNFSVWGADEIARFLDKYSDIRTAYAHLLTPGDLIAKLIGQQDATHEGDLETIRTYLYTTLRREQNAQLDQAGDATDDHLQLQKVFFELHGSIQNRRRRGIDSSGGTLAEIQKYYRTNRRMVVETAGGTRIPIVHMLLTAEARRVVLVGGPGEGKSTAGQYLAQLHRAKILGSASDIAISEAYIPKDPRLPYRIILREFAQWIADQPGSKIESNGSLDEYICHHVFRTTSRRISTEALHHIFKTNPTLLILDGLDEVTDPTLKRAVTDNAEDFVARMSNVLTCDMQVLATTRPTGYNDQYNPEDYVHIVLENLEPTQIRAYVSRWSKARELDPSKADRLARGIEECLNDQHVRLLMNTPLQVTILILIITAGGTPPSQREALFNEYLDVIYRREQGKGSNIISTDKELLVGLHKFIGYTLHEQAASVSAADSTLPESSYKEFVSRFLLSNDPYSNEQKRKQNLDSITVDAGERLVLLVEPTASRYGFELRSLQEFFAACHLADTSVSTEQRYARFEAIARKYHWRNVALFFAGRVGRNYSGEAANIVEACKGIDRDGIDRTLRRGAELALLIASDRALNPNRRLQRSLLDIALRPLAENLTSQEYSAIENAVLRLPYEDVTDHVEPILIEQLRTLADSLLLNSIQLLVRVNPANGNLPAAIHRMSSSSRLRTSALTLALRLTPSAEGSSIVRSLLYRLTQEERRQSYYEAARIESPALIFETLRQSKIDAIEVEFLHSYIQFGPFVNIDESEFDLIPSTGGKHWILHALVTLDIVSTSCQARRTRFAHKTEPPVHSRQVSDRVYLSGDQYEFAARAGISIKDPLLAPFWAVHLWMGDVTKATLRSAVAFLKANSCNEFVASTFRGVHPAIDELGLAISDGSVSTKKAVDLQPWYGHIGWSKWADLRDRISLFNRRFHINEIGVRRRGDTEVLQALNSPAYESERLGLLKELPAPEWAFITLKDVRQGGPVPAYVLGSIGDQIGIALSNSSHPAITHSTLRMLVLFLDRNVHATSALLVLQHLANNYRPGYSGVLCNAVSAAYTCGLIGDPNIVAALTKIGRDADRHWSQSIYVQHQSGALTREMVRFLIDEDNHDLRAGAAVILASAARSAAMRGSSITGIRHPGLAKAHRALCSSPDPTFRTAGIALFILRRDWGTSAYATTLTSLFQTCATENEADMLQNLVDYEIQVGMRIDFWRTIFDGLIGIPMFGNLDGLIRDWIRIILQLSDQSIGAEEAALGLPLPDQTY